MLHDYPTVLMPDELEWLEKDLDFIDRLITRDVTYSLVVKAARAYLDLMSERTLP